MPLQSSAHAPPRRWAVGHGVGGENAYRATGRWWNERKDAETQRDPGSAVIRHLSCSQSLCSMFSALCSLLYVLFRFPFGSRFLVLGSSFFCSSTSGGVAPRTSSVSMITWCQVRSDSCQSDWPVAL